MTAQLFSRVYVCMVCMYVGVCTCMGHICVMCMCVCVHMQSLRLTLKSPSVTLHLIQ